MYAYISHVYLCVRWYLLAMCLYYHIYNTDLFGMCCSEALNFFNLLQNVYNVFSISTHRWEILNTLTTVKSLSETRWLARDDACKSLNENCTSIINVVDKIANDKNEKLAVCCEAKGIKKKNFLLLKRHFYIYRE